MKQRGRETFSISAPVMAEQLLIALMGIVSTALVSSIGEHAVSAVAMVESVSLIIVAFFGALSVGGSIVVAQYIGRKDTFSAKTAAGQAFLLSVSLSVIMLAFLAFLGDNVLDVVYAEADDNVKQAAYVFLFITVFSYPFLAATQTGFGVLRGAGNTQAPMLISGLMNVINVVLGLILIRGINLPFLQTPAFGVEGAAVALLTGRVAGCVVCMYYLIFKAKTLRLNKLRMFKLNIAASKTILRLGIPTSIESVLFQVGKVIMVMFLVRVSTGAIAANAIAWQLVNFVNVAGWGFAKGVAIQCGHKTGRGETDDIARTTYFGIAVSMALMAVVSLFMFVFFNQIAGLFNVERATMEYLRIIMFTAFFAMVFLWPWSFVVPSTLRAAGDVKFNMAASIACMWVFRIGLGYVLTIPLELGVFGVWLAIYADWLARGVVYTWRLRSGKWKGKGV